MASAFSFESDLSFKDAVKTFNAMENWVRKPNLDGKWLVRDNDRWGDYLSWYAVLLPSIGARNLKPSDFER